MTPRQVLAEAEAVAGARLGVAAYDESHPIEDEQGAPEEP